MLPTVFLFRFDFNLVEFCFVTKFSHNICGTKNKIKIISTMKQTTLAKKQPTKKRKLESTFIRFCKLFWCFMKIKDYGKVLKSKAMMVTILMILMIINMVKIAMKWWLQASSFSKELVKCNEHVHTWKPNYFFSTKFAKMCLKDSKTFKTFLKLWKYLELKGKRTKGCLQLLYLFQYEKILSW